MKIKSEKLLINGLIGTIRQILSDFQNIEKQLTKLQYNWHNNTITGQAAGGPSESSMVSMDF